MKIDVLVAEIGSTTTAVNAVDLGGGGDTPRLLGQGMGATLEDPGDVTVALRSAIRDLASNLGEASPDDLQWDLMMAASSAAGGLSMSVHGLVYDMTVRAAREAALGAGAVIKMVTAGEMTQSDVEELRRLKPKIILLAGGVDYGEKHTAIWNAKMIADSKVGCPVIYAGNVAARPQIRDIFEQAGAKTYFVDNVYPKVDELVVEPARRVIQQAFEEHIVTAPGMDKIRTLVDGPIMPTPGAVMEACKLLWPVLGDLCAVDVGGATVDVHSVAKGSPEIQAMLEAPEPLAKRTVEGDLGIHVNARNIAELVQDRVQLELGFDPWPVLQRLEVIPKTEHQVKLVCYLRDAAVNMAFKRHVGVIKHLYGPQGRMTVASGKDLSSVRLIIGTGGPLTRLPGGAEALSGLIGKGDGRELYPAAAEVALDSQYIMAMCGVLSKRFPEQAKNLLLQSLGLNHEVSGYYNRQGQVGT